ncbi:MAG TPA: hypothetical protein RMI62_09885 [Polyangiaceae bacterium LLY-WYZ-15_(1-7)]|nr:hypothetical protein [Polyangiaceae bacterium LLY-WYZ-15_(1-7)]
MRPAPHLALRRTTLLALALLLACDPLGGLGGGGAPSRGSSRGAAPSPAPGGPPTLADLVTQAEGGPCVWLHGARQVPGSERGRIRNAAEACQLAALRELAERGPAAAATGPLLRLLPRTRDRDTGDGVLPVRSATLAALAAFADDPAAIPALHDAASTLADPATRRAAAARLRALGHDPAEELERAATVAPDATQSPRLRLRAMRLLVAFDHAAADDALRVLVDAHPDETLDAAWDRADAGHPTWPAVAAYCEALSAPPSAPRNAAEQDAQRRARACQTIRHLSEP